MKTTSTSKIRNMPPDITSFHSSKTWNRLGFSYHSVKHDIENCSSFGSWHLNTNLVANSKKWNVMVIIRVPKFALHCCAYNKGLNPTSKPVFSCSFYFGPQRFKYSISIPKFLPQKSFQVWTLFFYKILTETQIGISLRLNYLQDDWFLWWIGTLVTSRFNFGFQSEVVFFV